MSDGIHIASVEVQNFHRLSVAEVENVPETGLVRVTGRNASGKTSLLRSIAAALGGAGEMLPDAIREGADGASVSLTLTTGFTVQRKVTESNPKGYLTVEGPDGGKFKQGKLSEWLGERSFDPLSFFSLKPDRMREVLLSLSTDSELPQKLADLRAEQQRIYDERTPWIAQERRAKQVRKPEGIRLPPVDTSAEMERLTALQEQQQAREECHELALDRLTKIRSTRATIDKLQAEINTMESDIKRWFAEQKEASRRLENELPDVAADIRAVKDRIAKADTINVQLEPWKEWDRARANAKEAGAETQKLSKAIDQAKASEKDLLQNAGIPVPSLSFDMETGEPMLNGHPLSGASGKERIDMAVSVAMAANPELRICLVDEAHALDDESMEALHDRAVAHGFQIWVARISNQGGCEIVVEDGVAKESE
jgi:recombinational DNA repair ATPase RecF